MKEKPRVPDQLPETYVKRCHARLIMFWHQTNYTFDCYLPSGHKGKHDANGAEFEIFKGSYYELEQLCELQEEVDSLRDKLESFKKLYHLRKADLSDLDGFPTLPAIPKPWTDIAGVYFLQAPVNGLIKIGNATRIRRRVCTLVSQSPVQINLVGHIPHSEPKIEESRLHKHFAGLRFRHEWFHPGKELIDFIVTLESNN